MAQANIAWQCAMDDTMTLCPIMLVRSAMGIGSGGLSVKQISLKTGFKHAKILRILKKLKEDGLVDRYVERGKEKGKQYRWKNVRI